MITSFEYIKSCGLPVVIYGMGDGADKVMDALRLRGIEVSAVMASDAFVRGQSFRGFKVKRLCEIEAELSEFVIVLGFASNLFEVMEHIKALSRRHKLLVPSVPVYGSDIFDRDFYEKNLDKITLARSLLADDRSRRIFDNIIEFLLTGELAPLIACQSDKKEALKDILRLDKNEHYLDLGAYRGDTIEEFLEASGNLYPPGDDFCGSITALEPDYKSFVKLKRYAGEFNNTLLLNKGIWSEDGTVNFAAKAGKSSTIYGSGTQCDTLSVDSIAFNLGRVPTYIKADVEGAEQKVLDGARRILKQYKPKLNFAAYHRAEDIFSLIIEIHNINPEYNIHLRHHPYIPFWDTNLYCV